MRHRLESWYLKLTRYREDAFISLFSDKGDVLLGLGCSYRELTCRVGEHITAQRIMAIDLEDNLSPASRERIQLMRSDIDLPFPLPDETVDVVSADQIIEHLDNPDNFFTELHRVLKPGGYAVVCTENLSAFHNLASLLLGFQAFSQNISTEANLGNPFSLHYRKLGGSGCGRHHTIFTLKGLRDMTKYHGFRVEKVRGIGYFPLFISRLLERIDPVHAYFIAIKISKIKESGSDV